MQHDQFFEALLCKPANQNGDRRWSFFKMLVVACSLGAALWYGLYLLVRWVLS